MEQDPLSGLLRQASCSQVTTVQGQALGAGKRSSDIASAIGARHPCNAFTDPYRSPCFYPAEDWSSTMVETVEAFGALERFSPSS